MSFDEASISDVLDALGRVEAALADLDRRLNAVISVIPAWPYGHAIRKAMDHADRPDDTDRPDDRPAHPRRAAVRAAVIGPARRT